MNNKIPDPDALFPNEYKTSCFIKNVITAPNVSVGDYTYYDDPVDPASFEKNNILFNWPEFGLSLIHIFRAVKLIAGAMADAVLEGRQGEQTEEAAAEPVAEEA